MRITEFRGCKGGIYVGRAETETGECYQIIVRDGVEVTRALAEDEPGDAWRLVPAPTGAARQQLSKPFD